MASRNFPSLVPRSDAMWGSSQTETYRRLEAMIEKHAQKTARNRPSTLRDLGLTKEQVQWAMRMHRVEVAS